MEKHINHFRDTKKKVRLIDANDLMVAFRSHMVESYDRNKCTAEENCKTCEPGCLWRKIVTKAPTVDAEIVKHGRWIIKYIKNSKYHYAYCSECETMGSPQWKRCPVCEAKMDGERKDNENP